MKAISDAAAEPTTREQFVGLLVLRLHDKGIPLPSPEQVTSAHQLEHKLVESGIENGVLRLICHTCKSAKSRYTWAIASRKCGKCGDRVTVAGF